jgi:polysaccharide pyruvyl transferase WcaK-like protein
MSNYFILGHFGGFNTGDEAMLGGFLSLIPKTSAVSIKYKNGVDVHWGDNVTLFHGSYTDFVAPIGPGDTLVLCGGTHFHDDYSPIRLLRHWLYLARINYLFDQAKRKGAQTQCIGNGFGPISSGLTGWLTRQFIKLCDVVTVRDKNSARALAALDCKADLVHPDLAMLLYKPDRRVVKKNIIGVSLTSLTSQSADTISDDVLVHSIAGELTSFSDINPDVLVRLFVIRSGNRESDAPIMDQLHQLLQRNGVQSEVYTFTNDLNDLVEQMIPCRVFLASRFHSAVLGAVSQNKLIILSYHKKLVSLAEEMAMDRRYVIDLQQPTAADKLSHMAGTIAELYAANTLNYSFPETEILQLGEHVRTIYEEGLDFRVHANLRRATQPGEPFVPASTRAAL